MKKVLKYLGLFLFLMVVGMVAVRMNWLGTNQVFLPTGEKVNPEELPSSEVLSVVAEQMNQALPIKVGRGMELRSVEGVQGELIYHYIKAIPSSESFDRNQFIEDLRPLVLRRACKDQGMAIFFTHGVRAHYDFREEDDQLIGEIIITPRQCGY
ncbi:conserved hypothetical protein [Nitrosococcus halophilus Nc 4]|uniref:Uncharacterized protein n=1 Tax=Nitrosococcus halophilus (strain Nc4) TaxID=472759 RepID=D5C2D5_NITHN|nr:hypothetical protein [Nitrosococcus halophilus]ADE14794.1 conserved hypothetical protein [Nitrosococcus halophilus Nc 4]